jgi:hypothetical protein
MLNTPLTTSLLTGRYWSGLALLLVLVLSNGALAQQWRTEQPSKIDQQFMAQQLQRIEDLTQRHFGRRLTGERNNDLPLLQRLLDEYIVGPDDKATLQAMGMVLGEVIRQEEKLSWIIYIDKYGRSRALSVPKQRDVLFPITMISRRAETGAKVNIEEVYQRALSELTFIRQQILVP